MAGLDLTGRKYLVTGASSGIGQAAAVLISKLGGKVILNGRGEERLRQTLMQMEGEGHQAMPFDLTNLEGIKGYVDSCLNIDGQQFDGVVFAAGMGAGSVLRTESLENLQNVMQVNFLPYFSVLKACGSRRVLHDGGSIVAVSSRAAEKPDKAQVSYASSKAALDAASQVAALEFAKRSVRVNTVRPEMVDTPMSAGFFESVDPERQREFYPLGPLTAEDVANTIVFLLSDMSRKITGQHIYLSAGNDGRPIDFLI